MGGRQLYSAPDCKVRGEMPPVRRAGSGQGTRRGRRCGLPCGWGVCAWTCLRGKAFFPPPPPASSPPKTNNRPHHPSRREASSERARRENFRGDNPLVSISCRSRCQPSRNAGGGGGNLAGKGLERRALQRLCVSVCVCLCAQLLWFE